LQSYLVQGALFVTVFEVLNSTQTSKIFKINSFERKYYPPSWEKMLSSPNHFLKLPLFRSESQKLTKHNASTKSVYLIIKIQIAKCRFFILNVTSNILKNSLLIAYRDKFLPSSAHYSFLELH
jgi:hypothetical protein